MLFSLSFRLVHGLYKDDATVGFSLDLHDVVVEAAFIPSIAAVQYTLLTTPERANEGAGK